MRTYPHQSGGSSSFRYLIFVVVIVTVVGFYNLFSFSPSSAFPTSTSRDVGSSFTTSNPNQLRSSSSSSSYTDAVPKVTDEVLSDPSVRTNQPKVWFKKDRPDLNYAPELPVTYTCSAPLLWGTDHQG